MLPMTPEARTMPGLRILSLQKDSWPPAVGR